MLHTLDSLFSLDNTLIGLHLIMCRLIQSSCSNINPLVSFLCAVQISISRNYINAQFPPKHKFAPAVATQCFHNLPKKKFNWIVDNRQGINKYYGFVSLIVLFKLANMCDINIRVFWSVG